MPGDDATAPDPLFKNVTRRPRSAASWPRNEEPEGGDPVGISVCDNASPTPVSSNKRPASSIGGGAAHVPRAKKRLVVPIEEPEPEDAKDRGVGMPPALSHKDKAAAASSASSSEAEPDVDWAGNERRRKGKTPVVNQDDNARAPVARRPLAGKLLGDAIGSHGSTAVAGSRPPSRTTKPKKPRTKPKKPAKKDRSKSKKKEKPTKKTDSSARFWCGTGKEGTSSAGSDMDYSFDRIAVVSDRLRATLRDLGVAAPAPVRLYGRLLTRCDRDIQQARLLMSCKKWRADGAVFPPYAFLTEEERKEANGEGLLLTAYDRGGDAYELKLRFLECNVACRLISKWSDFLRHNGLVVGKDDSAPVGDEVMVDLWFFRTPVGKVGMVVLHYRRGDAPHADAALDEREHMSLQLMMKNGDAAAAAAVMEEDVVGDANEVGYEDAGVIGEVVAAAPAPSSPSSEPNGGGGGGGAIEAAEAADAPAEVAAAPSPSEPDGVAAKAAEEQAGALGEVADAPSSTSSEASELHGGAPSSDEVTAPLSLGGDGTEASGALMVMVLEVEAAATQSSLDSNAGGAAMMETEDDEAAAELAQAAALMSWKVTKYEFHAAQGLLMLSKANSNS